MLSKVFILSFISAVVAAPAEKGQVPFSFPLKDGFPNPSQDQLAGIFQHARGTLPNGPLPTEISDTAATVFSAIAFNELFEVAFFSSLINNITSGVSGYGEGNNQHDLTILKTIRAQEELHALGANGILAHAGRETIQPCKYIFPTTNFKDALAFAATFTDLVLGVLQEAVAVLGLAGDYEFLRLLPSVIGQEGEQDGWFRSYGAGKVPSALPFLTSASGAFGYSALNQQVILPGSCSATPNIPIKIFAPLIINTKHINVQTTSLKFTIQSTTAEAAGYSLVYINQQNVPIVMPLKNIAASGSGVTFTADFPYREELLNGLTIAAVTAHAGPYTDATEVAADTVFGPGLIEIK